MVDLHCHYLPGVDDGAPDVATGLALARASVADGIGTAVLTPHVFPGRWNNARGGLEPRLRAFRRAATQAGIPLEMHLGAEVHLLPESLRLYEAGEIPALGALDGRPVILLELPDGGIPPGALRAVDFLTRRGALPMLAHPERNKDVMRSTDRLAPFVEAGCLVQLTAASVCGLFGAPAHRTALEILDAGWATVVATDAHHLRHRPPVLSRARRALLARYGEEAARLLTRTHPAAIVAGRASCGDGA
jgi:protein-tyrosine phosphatase